VDGPRSIGELAERMGVTQQAASKAAGELERLGYVERRPDPADARVRRVALSARGVEAVARTREIRAGLEAELVELLGARRIAELKEATWAVLEWTGGAAAVRARRVPSIRG
jgi:DNA-binding MarR family transcriptional regulator